MALVIPPGFASMGIELRHSADPDSWFVTYGVDLSGIGGDFAGAMSTSGLAFENAWADGLSNNVTIVAVHARIGQDGGEPINLVTNWGVNGTSVSEMLPQNCALLVRKQTARGGRTGRGRCFVPAVLKENQVSSAGVIPSGEVAALQNRANTWGNILENGNADPATPATPMVLLHNTGAPGGTTPTPIFFLQVDSIISTQRRRLR